LRDDAREGEHGGAAVRDLDGRVVLLRLVVERVEAIVAGRAVGLSAQHLGDRNVAERLEDTNHAKQEQHAAVLDGLVVRRQRRHRRRTRPRVAAVDRDVAEEGEHADAAVLQLGLAHPLDVVRAAQLQRVEAIVAGHGAVEVSRHSEEGDGLALALGGEAAGLVDQHRRRRGAQAGGGHRALHREGGREGGRDGEHGDGGKNTNNHSFKHNFGDSTIYI